MLTCKVANQRFDQLVALVGEKNSEDDSNLLCGAIKIQNCNFKWPVTDKDKKTGEFILKNVSLQVNPCELLMIVGTVGSGKSSLILGLLEEMDREAFDKNKN